MTFWQWLDNKWVRIGAVSGQFFSALTFAVASGMFAGLLAESSVKWLALISFLVSTGILGVGQRNSTQIKVAEAKSDVAKAMETAILSTPSENTNARF